MSDIMRPVPFDELINRAFSEYRNHGSVFGIQKENFYKTGKNIIEILGKKCSTPIGPAAGPHTQLAQNIVASYLSGGRFIELKTVQIMDYLGEKKMISKPCIDARDEGFNVEWSTEYTLEKAFDEYLKAWFLINVFQALLTGKFEKPDFIFNMSVGYNLEGIKQPRMQVFIDSMRNAENHPLFNEYRGILDSLIEEGEFFCGSDFEKNAKALNNLTSCISAEICNSVTVSTMHGCPPEEIEAICSYMIKEKGLHTYVKLNPTLLGYDEVRTILNQTGFNRIELSEESFKHDLQLDDSFGILHRLLSLAKNNKLEFGVKLTNTLANINSENIFEGKERYMSGRALLPISTKVASLISKEFNGELPVSYSGGANIYSVGELFACGIKPITLATDMLKPGGYSRMKSMACLLDSQKEGWNTKAVNVKRLTDFAENAVNFDYIAKDFRGTFKAKTVDKLPLFDCFVSPCQEACPVHQCIPDYINLVSEERYADALSLIYKDNALPGITCSICDHQCQYHCSRMDYEGAVEIRQIKKIAELQGYGELKENLSKNKITSTSKVAVVGAGPAGLSASYFLAREGISVTVFEKEKNAGGVVANIIPSFRIDKSVIKADIDFIKGLGVDFVFGVDSKDVSLESLKKSGFDYIIYAVGAEKGNCIRIEGDTSFVTDGLDFLKSFKSGDVSLGKNVIVAGAGNSAMDCARAAKRCKDVSSVTVVYRRTVDEMPACYEEYSEALKEGVKFRFLANPKGIHNGVLTCSVVELGEKDSSGRRSPVITDKTVELPCNRLILALGEHIDSESVSKFGFPLNDKGWPIVNPNTNETEVKNVYSVGDMVTGPSTVVRCIKSARLASDDIISKLLLNNCSKDNDCINELSDEEFFEEEDKFYERINQKKAKLYPNREKIISDFKKFAKQEENRCLNCSYICSKCVDVCPNRANVAIDMRCSENSVDAFQILHLDAYCNECGNCATFCSHLGKPYKDKFTLFSREDDFENSSNSGFYVEGSQIKVRLEGVIVKCNIDGNGRIYGDIPIIVKDLIEEVFIGYGYLLGRVDE